MKTKNVIWTIYLLFSMTMLGSCNDDIITANENKASKDTIVIDSAASSNKNVHISYTVALFDASEFTVGSSKISSLTKMLNKESYRMNSIKISVTHNYYT